MAERNPQVPHSIHSLLYVERNGSYCGYKPELIIDGIHKEWERFIICAECKGISRRARQERGNTVCEMCIKGPAGNLDERVEHKVASLSSKCPLSGKGCGWKGKLREIERHMQYCDKMFIECRLKCGSVFKRESNGHHNRVECQLRMVGCEFCRERVRAKEMNEHTRKCQLNPHTNVSCPFKELGCNDVYPRNRMDIHLIGNILGHQKLMLDQLRNRELTNKGRRKGALWVMLTAVIAIAAAVAVAQFSDRQSKLQETMSSLAETKSSLSETKSSLAETIASLAETKSSLAETKSSLVETKSDLGIAVTDLEETKANLKETQANLRIRNAELGMITEYIRFNSGYTSKYMEEIGKVLPGIELIFYFREEDDIYGPTFYLNKCRVRLKVNKYFFGTSCIIERLDGEYDDVIISCRIKYIYITFRSQLDDIKTDSSYSDEMDIELRVGDPEVIWHRGHWYERKVRTIVYFDTYTVYKHNGETLSDLE